MTKLLLNLLALEKLDIVDHKEIVAALEARDTGRAERLVREHTLRLRDHVERFVELD